MPAALPPTALALSAHPGVRHMEFGDVALIVIGLGGAKYGSKRGRGIVTRQFHQKTDFFSLHFGSLQALCPSKLLQDALVWC